MRTPLEEDLVFLRLGDLCNMEHFLVGPVFRLPGRGGFRTMMAASPTNGFCAGIGVHIPQMAPLPSLRANACDVAASARLSPDLQQQTQRK